MVYKSHEETVYVNRRNQKIREKEQSDFERVMNQDYQTDSEEELSNLQQARIRTERRYIENLQEGRHLRKNGKQI